MRHSHERTGSRRRVEPVVVERKLLPHAGGPYVLMNASSNARFMDSTVTAGLISPIRVLHARARTLSTPLEESFSGEGAR